MMPTMVYEMSGNIANSIHVDGELIFPNVQTCVALVGVNGGTMAGAHLTLADRNRLSQVGAAVLERLGGDGTLYVVGPIDEYNISALGTANARACRTPGFLEVRATNNGVLEFFVRPIGGGDWQRLEISQFT